MRLKGLTLMEIYQAIILGIIQGLTEFLPVSSSGHLVLGQHLFGLKDVPLYFDVSLHIGTLGAIFIVFFKEIKAIVVAFFYLCFNIIQKKNNLMGDKDTILLILIIAGSIPTAFLGLMFNKMAEQLFSSVTMVGFMLLITGTLLWLTRYISNNVSGNISDNIINERLSEREIPSEKNVLNKKEPQNKFTLQKALMIGVVQGFAVIPGISRSGSTIVAGMFLGLPREEAARFSFLLSIPAIIGAAMLSFSKIETINSIFQPSVLLGTLASFIVGYFALIILLRIVKHGNLYIFAPYCWCIGLFAIIGMLL